MSIYTIAPATWTNDLPVPNATTFNKEIHDRLTDIDTYVLNKNNFMPAGVIVMWSGSIATIPTGWYLCDGFNGTPDLRGNFIIGSGYAYAVGATGGEGMHTLSAAEMPVHTHTQNAHIHSGAANLGSQYPFTAGDPHQTQLVTNTDTGSTTATNQNAGSGSSHNNLPPYYALAYIMKS